MTMAGKLNEGRVNSYENNSLEVVASNSLVCDNGDAVRITSGFITKTGVGERIDGVSMTLKTFSATNQTVEKDVVLLRRNLGDNKTYMVPVSGGTITQANVGQYFAMTSTQALDFATASATTGVYRVVGFAPGGLVAEVELTTQGS